MNLTNAINKYKTNGGFFFDKDSMDFWGTTIVGDLYKNNCFITSEFDWNGKNKFYNVRQFIDNYKSVITIGEFNKLKTIEEAIEIIKTI